MHIQLSFKAQKENKQKTNTKQTYKKKKMEP